MADQSEGARDRAAARKIVELGEVKAGVKMPAGRYVVLEVKGGKGAPPAALALLGADGKPVDELQIGAGSALRLQWSVNGGATARLRARALVEKGAGEAVDPPADAAHVSNDQLVSPGLDLPLDVQGAGSGVVLVDPGPVTSTEYTLTVTAKEGAEAPEPVKATARVANFNVRLELPDGSDYARNMECVLVIPGQAPIRGTTSETGELWLSVPNADAESATLRLLDGGSELASWQVALRAEEASTS